MRGSVGRSYRMGSDIRVMGFLCRVSSFAMGEGEGEGRSYTRGVTLLAPSVTISGGFYQNLVSAIFSFMRFCTKSRSSAWQKGL